MGAGMGTGTKDAELGNRGVTRSPARAIPPRLRHTFVVHHARATLNSLSFARTSYRTRELRRRRTFYIIQERIQLALSREPVRDMGDPYQRTATL
jgi:hypothetical protein